MITLLLQGRAFADDVVVCDPTHPLVPNAVTRIEYAVDPGNRWGQAGFLIWRAPNTTMTPEQIASLNALRGQMDALKPIPYRYWICADTNPVDGILESVREMTQAEKDALDAPETNEAARLAALRAEADSLETAVDDALSNWSSLTTAQKTDTLRKGMRLTRVYRLLQGAP